MPVASRRLSFACLLLVALATCCRSRSPTLSGSEGALRSDALDPESIEAKGLRIAASGLAARVRASHGHEAGHPGVAIAVTSAAYGDERGFQLSPVLTIAGKSVLLKPRRVAVDEQPGAKRLLLESRSGGEDVTVRLTVRLGTGDAWAEVTTTIEHTRPSPLRDVRVGLLAEWPGRATFAPAVGFVRGAGTARVPWVARQGDTTAHALVFPDGPEDATFVADHVGPLGVVVWSAYAELQPGVARGARRLATTRGGTIADLAKEAWARARVRTGTLHGTLSPPPSWSLIEAFDERGRLVLEGKADAKGTWRLPLPPGRYSVRLKTPGGMDELRASVREAEEVPLDLLPPTPGHIQLFAVDDRNEALPVRFTVRGTEGTSDPILGPGPIAQHGVVLAEDGKAFVQLPEGAYEVTATRGIEYSRFVRKIVVRRNAGSVVRARLARTVDTRGYVACDFHLHAAPSFDSDVPLEQRVLSLLVEGVEFAAATDHNVVTDYSPAIGSLPLKGRLSAAAGIEVTTKDWGHFNAFPFGKASDPPPNSEANPADIFAFVRKQAPEAVIQVNHPLMGDIGYFNRGELDVIAARAREGFSFEFDTLEVWNGFDLPHAETLRANLRRWFELVNAGFRYTAVGNSDSHQIVGQWAGYPRSYVRADDDAPGAVDPLSVVRGLKSGAVLVTNGPFLTVTAGGDPLPALVSAPGGRILLHAQVQKPDWVHVNRLALIVDGEEVATQPVTFPDGSGIVQLPLPIEVADDSWVVLTVSGDEPLEAILPGKNARPFAFTNPLFLDADGDGAFRFRSPK